MTQLLAMDRSVRSRDSFGRLVVEMSNISKAAVNPYYGREIPNAVAMGLDLDTIYYLLRDPEELRKAAATFNGVQVLWRHDGNLKASNPLKDLVVGTTGTDAVFDEPYLRNSLVIWDADAILAIDLNVQKELSSAYAYDADMTPGSYGGVKYDGVMRNIRGNHVALVTEGRAGPDVVVGDSKLLENPKMKLSPLSVALLGALTAYSATVIAQDAQIAGDLRAIAGGVKTLKTAKERKAVIAAYTKVAAGKINEGMALDALPDLVEAVGDADIAEDPPEPGAMDGDFGSQLAALLTANGMTPEVITKIQALCSGGAMDADPDDKEDKVDKPAMDAAINAATAATRAQLLAVRTAEIEVQPIIGNLSVAMDSAADVYKLALDQLKVDLTDVDPASYRSVFRAVKGSATAAPPATRVIAQDAANTGASSFATMFPNANRVGVA